MAPIQQQTNASSCLYNGINSSNTNVTSSASKSTSKTASSVVNSSSSNVKSSSNTSVQNTLSGMESLLPIASRGLFHDDSHFEESRQQFHEAVRKVLEDWDVKRGQLEDDFTSYRILRESDLREDNQAISISQDDTSHKIVLDVKDFMEGDIKVKMVDENELVVEGEVEKQEGGCVSKKSFRRSFFFPGLAKAEAVSSAMSSDGVLKVTIPKNNSNFIKNTTQENFSSSSLKDSTSNVAMPITQKGSFFDDSFFESARMDFEKAVEDIVRKRENNDSARDNMVRYRHLRESNMKDENQAISVTEDNDQHKVVLDVKDFMNGDLQVKMVNENELKVEGSIEVQIDDATSKKSFSRTFRFPGPVNSEAVSSAMSSDGILKVTVPKIISNGVLENNVSSKVSCEERNEESKVSVSKNISDEQPENNITQRNKSVKDCSYSDTSLLPVFNKGLFFHDDFFKSARHDYENAVKEVLNKWGKENSLLDSMSSYRSLRDMELTEENQAVSVTEDHQCHKVVMDVKDFMQQEVKVKVVDDNELVIEGSVEKKNGGSVSKKSFNRSYVFPGLVKTDSVSSAMSSDGILTVTVPKKSAKEGSSKTETLKEEDSNRTSKMSENISSIQTKEKSSHHSLQNTSEYFKNLHSREDELEKLENRSPILSTQEDLSFHDEFFESARREFENSLKASNEWVDFVSSKNDINAHNSIKDNCETFDQTVSMTEDDKTHKIVVNVKDFVEGGLQVKMINDNEISVEGHKEENINGKSSSKTFSRKFQLPGSVRVDGISSTLSKDGFLRITAVKDPKRPSGCL
ncbi:hypothetical protein SK128_006750 [Halocaridina rubra]|uniref:SHSP domain-containing protein n=1 Tax=Halocaridina rubra TaxID=373956 RepID=A0AAN9A5V2_HALRR